MSIRRHRAWLYVALAAFTVFYALSVFTAVRTLTSVGPGLTFFDDVTGNRAVGAVPMTAAAAADLEGMQGFLQARTINGVGVYEIGGTEPAPVRARRFALAGPPTSVVELVDETGEARTVTLAHGRPELAGIPGFVFVGLVYQLVGLFYLAVGLLVFLRRPGDRAASWLLLLGIVAATHLVQPGPDDVLGWYLNLIAAAVFPLYGPASMGLVLSFTGAKLEGWSRRLHRLIVVSALALVPVLPATFYLWSADYVGTLGIRVALVLIGLELGLSVGLFLWVCKQAVTRGTAPAVRRRAQLLAIAVGLAFGLPTLELLIFPLLGTMPLELVVPNLVCFAAFPVVVGYAILRYQAFDLRIVLRRGAVYAVLSLLVSLAFVASVLLLVEQVGNRAQSTAALWLTSMVLVIGIGLLQLRVQGFVDRWANRKRIRYAEGLEAVTEDLVRANSLQALSDMARRALIDGIGISRAYVALRTGDAVDCFLLENRSDPETGNAPPALPTHFAMADMPPVLRSFELEEMTTAYDADAVPSLEGAAPLDTELWFEYGLECVVPLLRRVEGRQTIIGFLLLGPRYDGQALDAEDRNLLRLLANQLTVAAENALAFEQIRALKDGLETTVQARTRALEQAMTDLKSAEAQIVESEKQAMLGRLVAGLVHEVNTPLGALTSSSDTLHRILRKLEDELPEEGPARRRLEMGKELTELQLTSGARLSEIVDSLKNFVSLDEAGVQELDVRDGIDSALRLLSNDIPDELRIVRDYPSEIPRVRAHGQRLNQVFLAVLQNSVKALGGAGQLQISVSGTPKDGLRITIEDDGPGIPPELLPDLFDFGFTNKDGRVGLRLGLPSSARTVRELGGDIYVESEPGEGTCVHIDLPIRPRAELDAQASGNT